MGSQISQLIHITFLVYLFVLGRNLITELARFTAVTAISNRAINERAINRRAINDYMERLHPMMKYGNFIDVYNNHIYFVGRCSGNNFTFIHIIHIHT